MTDNDLFSTDSDKIIADGLTAVEAMRERVRQIERAKAEQPNRLAEARSDAEEARGWALLEETLASQITAVRSSNGGTSLALPNVLARELWGARLAFDLLDYDDGHDEIDATIGRLLTAANGDTGVTMTVMAAALSTIATLIVPQLLHEIEYSGSNWDERVRLCAARAKAWHGRVHELRQADDEAHEHGIKGIDGYDIGSTALDDEGDL